MSTQSDPDARYRAVQARMDAIAARRHAARVAESTAQEAQLRAKVDAAVREAVQRIAPSATPVTEVAPAASAPVAESTPDKPLHQMSPDEFRQHSHEAWAQHAETMQSPVWKPRPPMTISDYIARGSGN